MSNNNNAIRVAFRKGYRVTDEGSVVNAVGGNRKAQTRKTLRQVFNVGVGGGKRHPVYVHKLQAYQKFGEAIFEPGIVVRHLDGNPLNNRPENIAIGTISDNVMDRDPLERQLHAQKGNRGTGIADEETWLQIKKDHDEGLGYKKLRKKYGVSLASLSYRLSKTSAYRLLENR
jgi:HNH endonuclease